MHESTFLPTGAPARLTALASVVGSVVLVGTAAARGGLAGEGELISPWIIAAATFLGAAWLAWRALTQVVELDADGATVRNLSSTFRVEWRQIEAVTFRRRMGLVGIELDVVGLRRKLTLGAATRFAGEEADHVAGVLAGHPALGRLF